MDHHLRPHVQLLVAGRQADQRIVVDAPLLARLQHGGGHQEDQPGQGADAVPIRDWRRPERRLHTAVQDGTLPHVAGGRLPPSRHGRQWGRGPLRRRLVDISVALCKPDDQRGLLLRTRLHSERPPLRTRPLGWSPRRQRAAHRHPPGSDAGLELPRPRSPLPARASDAGARPQPGLHLCGRRRDVVMVAAPAAVVPHRGDALAGPAQHRVRPPLRLVADPPQGGGAGAPERRPAAKGAGQRV